MIYRFSVHMLIHSTYIHIIILDISEFVKLCSEEHSILKNQNVIPALLIGKYKKTKTCVNVTGLHRVSGKIWEELIFKSNMEINREKWINFSADINKLSFLYNNSFYKEACFDLEEAFLRQLLTNSYPNKREKNILSININGKVIKIHIRYTSFESIKRWITPGGPVTRIKKNNVVTKCSKHSFGCQIEVLLSENAVLKVVQNNEKKINDTVFNSPKVFVNGIGYVWIPGTNIMYCEILLHCDFLRQVNMEIYTKNGGNNIRCDITNYHDEYKGSMVLFQSKNTNNGINTPQVPLYLEKHIYMYSGLKYLEIYWTNNAKYIE